MRSVALTVACALLLILGGCGSAKDGGGPAKHAFVSGADRICLAHAQAVITWLDEPQSGAVWQQQASQDEGLYEIIDRSIKRLQALGPPPGPKDAAFTGYLSTLEARASLYKLTSVAFLHRDTIFALRLENRIKSIDVQGDGYAHAYGLRVCGTGLKDLAKAFDAAGWTPPQNGREPGG
jgi:hypothetical protein